MSVGEQAVRSSDTNENWVNFGEMCFWFPAQRNARGKQWWCFTLLFLCSLLRLGVFTHITHACFVEVCLISYMINNKLCSNTTTHMQADRYKMTEETKCVMCSPLAFSLFFSVTFFLVSSIHLLVSVSCPCFIHFLFFPFCVLISGWFSPPVSCFISPLSKYPFVFCLSSSVSPLCPVSRSVLFIVLYWAFSNQRSIKGTFCPVLVPSTSELILTLHKRKDCDLNVFHVW